MTAPWSTQPITGAQHAAWMADESDWVEFPMWESYEDGDETECFVVYANLRTGAREEQITC